MQWVVRVSLLFVIVTLLVITRLQFRCAVDSVAVVNAATGSIAYYQTLPISDPPSNVTKSYTGISLNETLALFMSTVQEREFQRPANYTPPESFYDIVKSREKCLPEKKCINCLSSARGATRRSCMRVCSCLSRRMLCKRMPDAQHLAKEVTVSPPVYAKDHKRLIPRIIHQTWFEELSVEDYPNMIRMQSSFRYSGYEYRFYNDTQSATLISQHFPSEVREAYDSLLPGAFKIDLFRYCALLIHGGVYADMDVLLESSLDSVIEPDVGFMVPYDTPGRNEHVGKGHCVWSTFLASAPGHPFLVKAIETAVNQIRNRQTILDIDVSYCPAPELSVMHRDPDGFITGSCLLGSTINRVAGRVAQKQFEGGNLELTWGNMTAQSHPDEYALRKAVPGRTVILNQDLSDMGANRFSLVAENRIVGATHLPAPNDKTVDRQERETHLFNIKNVDLVFGRVGVYVDNKRSNENIKVTVGNIRR